MIIILSLIILQYITQQSFYIFILSVSAKMHKRIDLIGLLAATLSFKLSGFSIKIV